MQNYNLNILIIEDDYKTKQDLIKILKYPPPTEPNLDILDLQIVETNLPKFTTYTATENIEAIKIIQKFNIHNKKFTLVFIDIHFLPEIDGINTIHSIWEIDKDIQIVICTSLNDDIWKKFLKSFGISDDLLILQKPFDYTMVKQLIYTLTKKWLLMQESENYNQLLENCVQKRTVELEYKANHDPLTSLPNRNLLEDGLSKLIKTSKNNNVMFAILYIDLDNFKFINDNYTHSIGDQILKIISKRIVNNTRKQDDFFRIGGDEFVLLVTNIEALENINNIANNLLQIIQKPIKLNNIDIEAKLSIGISIYPMHGIKSVELLKNADLAMYKAKKLGGNKFEFYNKELYIATRANLDLESELHKALANKEFFLCYLPQIELASKKLIAVEALIRWNHPQLGLIPAARFIPYAEKYALISPINEWVIKHSILQNKIWHDKGINIVPISVNIGIQQIKHTNLIENITKILQNAKLAPKYFGIDITENTYVNSEEIINIINNIKKSGVQITLDNFGSGSIPLNYLKKLQIDYLKIDRSFIDNIEIDPNNKIIIRSIINIANSLKLKIIAVGIETWQHKAFFEQYNCQFGEGYYFSKPLLTNELELLLKLNKKL